MSGDRESAIKRALIYLESGDFEEELARRVALRTESQKPDNIAALSQYLDAEMIPAFEQLGFSCKVFDNPMADRGPILLATPVRYHLTQQRR